MQVKILENHIPIANDDYVSTNWMKSISIDLLRNDHDINGDLDPSSLKILTRPEFGDVIPGKAGIITYVPLQNRVGYDKFYYQISDSCSQRDTAMVTINLVDPPLYLPHGISPNGDGHNDKFTIGGLKSYPKSSLTIFSRDGLTIYKNDDYQNDWDGLQYRLNGNSRPYLQEHTTIFFNLGNKSYHKRVFLPGRISFRLIQKIDKPFEVSVGSTQMKDI